MTMQTDIDAAWLRSNLPVRVEKLASAIVFAKSEGSPPGPIARAVDDTATAIMAITAAVHGSDIGEALTARFRKAVVVRVAAMELKFSSGRSALDTCLQ